MSTRRHTAWDAALQTIRKLRAAGHVAFLAGGCVRDRLLSRPPKDYDVATDATPARVKTVFPRARQVGAKFGVMLVRRWGHEIEVATFRTEGPYSDGRHPDQVAFGTDEEDARRRDFTINGLFFDPFEDRVIDYVGGQEDLASGLIRTIGEPDRRFAEDHLRMLRAVRFSARLGFDLESSTAAAIQRLAPHLDTISAERVWLEIEMILTDPSRATGWSLLVETGLRAHLAKAWPPDPGADELTRSRLAALPPRPIDAALALAAALCGAGENQAGAVCRALRLSNRLSRSVLWLIRSRRRVLDERSLEPADVKLLMAGECWPLLPELLRAEVAATGVGREAVGRILDRARAIPQDQIAPPPLLSGGDLCDMGMSPGPRMGTVLKAVYRAQLNEQILTREAAAALARSLMRANA